MSDDLDLNALRNLKDMIGGDPSDLRELLDDFVFALPRELAKMREASLSGDLTALRITAHSCKSNARDLGAATLSILCAALEGAAAEARTTDVSNLIPKIEVAVETALANYATLDLSDV